MPAVASQEVAVGSSINTESFATYVVAPLSKTVTPQVFAASCTHFFGFPSIASAETLTPRAVNSLESSPL